MKKVKSYLSLMNHIRNGEHFDFFTNIIDYVNAKVLKAPALLTLWSAFRILFEKEDDIYKRSLKSVETKFIDEANLKRDESFMKLKRDIGYESYSDDGQRREAALLLTEVMDNYKNIVHATFTESTALIINMIQDLRKARYAEATFSLGLTAAIAQLEKDNDAFKEVYIERAQQLSAQKSQGGMVEIRPLVNKSFHQFTEAANALYASNELLEKNASVRENLSYIIDFINAYIEQYERIYSRRNPDYKPGDKNDQIPDIPDVQIPRFGVREQLVVGQSEIMPNFGAQMSVEIAEKASFLYTLYPVAKGGVLHLKTGTPDFSEFPIADFLMDGETAVGLLVDPPPGRAYSKPFIGEGGCEAEVVKDDIILAFLDGMQYPSTIGKG